MTTANVLDIDALLEPISEEAPAGPDLRDDPSPTSPYQQIKMARKQAGNDERRKRQAEPEEADRIHPDWAPILNQVPEVLQSQSKDMQIATFLIEALIREHGFQGLSDGFELIRGLIENFWNRGLHPQRDGNPAGVFESLDGGERDGTLIPQLRSLSIARAADGTDICLTDFDRSQPPEPAVRPQDHEFYQQVLGEVEACAERLAALENTFDSVCGESGPSTGNLRRTLRECLERVRPLVPDSSAESEGADGEAADDAEVAPGAGDGSASGPIQTRAQAYRQIEAVVQYLERYEPHNPARYALQQAVRWGRDMTLPELISEWLEEDGSRDQIYKLTGMPRPRSEEENEQEE